MRGPYAMSMPMLGKPVLRACLASFMLACSLAAHAESVDQDRGQGMARERRERGQNLPSREIERRVVPNMRGAQYLGFDYDPESDIYTLKFLRNGSVIWVEVDGHSGRILRRVGE